MAYETEKQRERKDRAESRATHLHAKADQQLRDSDRDVRNIPLGQPILVGHHSEKRHRKALERTHARTHQAVETHEAAKSADWAARSAGRAITSDDPEAVVALKAKLTDLEVARDRAKQINKAWRKGGEEAMRALDNIPEALINQIVRTMSLCPWMKKTPCPTTNTSAEIRRVKTRIEELLAEAARPEAESIEGDGFTIEEDTDDCRVRFFFDTRPDKETCRKMRGAGFKFSRLNGAWQRLLNSNGRRAALRMASELFGHEG
jgi:hypothetical protein